MMENKTQRIRLENDVLEAQISLHGAELKSLKKKEDGTEYMWNADPAYWGRTSFPLWAACGIRSTASGTGNIPWGSTGLPETGNLS